MSTEIIEWSSHRRRRLAVELRASRWYAVEDPNNTAKLTTSTATKMRAVARSARTRAGDRGPVDVSKDAVPISLRPCHSPAEIEFVTHDRTSQHGSGGRVLLGWINAAADHVPEPSRSYLRACRPAWCARPTSTPPWPRRPGCRAAPFGLQHRRLYRLANHSSMMNAGPSSLLRRGVPPPCDLHDEVALSWCLRDYHSCLGVQLDSELDDMLLRGKLPQRFQHGANCRSCGVYRLVEARLGLKHPYLVASDVLRANADFGDLDEHWTMPCFELNNLGHTNRPYDWLDGDQREKRFATGARTTGASSTLAW